MIELKHLTKVFGKSTVVEDASAQFEKGKVTSIIGPNGAGKSTLLSMASRLIQKDSGKVLIDSVSLEEWDTKELAKRLAVLRQANSITMRFTVREMVSFGRFPYSHGNLKPQDQQIIDQAIAYLDLTHTCIYYYYVLQLGVDTFSPFYISCFVVVLLVSF